MNAGDLKDYYALLGVNSSANTCEIHKAYWRKAYFNHPDKGGSHDTMVQIVEAWRILSDPAKRSRYDQMREFQQNGWRSRKFDEDVQDARKNAGTYARSWAEFEAVYQKAFYAFNQDFYGENQGFEPSGPFSPLTNSKPTNLKAGAKPKDELNGNIPKTRGDIMINYLFKTIFILLAVMFAFLWHRDNNGIGRYLLLSDKNEGILMLDTTNGAVYKAEKRTGTPSYWKEIIQPFRVNADSI